MAANILQQVITYQMNELALLQNLNAFVGTANTKYNNFDKIATNLGDTVSFDLPARYSSNPTLTAVFQGSVQRIHSLTVNKARNVSIEFTNQEFIFNVDEYMDKFGKPAVAEIGAHIEADIAKNCLLPYRFFGNGVTPINSYGQLAKAVSFYKDYGAVKTKLTGYLDNISVSDIVNTGLSQFVPSRNEKAAHSWMVGDYRDVTWTESNLLPVHISGTAGEAADVLTFVSINAAGTQLTLSGVSTDAGAVKEFDLFEFSTNIKYLTFTGHAPSQSPVQVRATADADAIAGTVIVNIIPALIVTDGDRNQNLSRALVGTDIGKFLPSHRRGMICGGDAMYLAMPQLADQYPFPTGNKVDPDSGVSMRMYYGSIFGQNNRGFVHDVIWGTTVVPDYSYAIVYPLE
jgi:hypothetical protein